MAELAANDTPLALDGVRVLALEASVSGPHCTRILGDMGAEVIKVEKPGTGDLIRGWDSAVHGLSSGFVWLKGNKRSFAVDVKKPAGREIVRRLGRTVDVVLENFAPGVADRMGLGAEELCARNPRLIYCSAFRLRSGRPLPRCESLRPAHPGRSRNHRHDRLSR